MSTQEPIAQKLATSYGYARPTDWETAREQLAGQSEYWLTTVMTDGRPHVRPLFTVWQDDRLYFVSSPTSRKAKNLTTDPRCVIAVSSPMAHLVVEGEAQKISDEAHLRRVAEVYDSKYGWKVEVRDGAFYDNGAPTAGPPPYEIYEVIFDKVYGFGTEESFSPTRWQF